MPNKSQSPTKQSFEVVVIGAGPAGMACAVRCAQLGLNTACIDSWSDKKGNSSLGGTYLSSGYAATLAILESAKIYHTLKHDIQKHGIRVESITLDIPQMIKRKDDIIDVLKRNAAELFAHHHIQRIHGKAKLLNEKLIECVLADKSATIIEARHIVLATGSIPCELPCAQTDNHFILDSATALNIDDLPRRLAIIGAGVIGLELACIWNKLGAKTTLLEAQDTFLNLPDQQISREAYRIFSAEGLDMRLGARVVAVKKSSQGVTVDYQTNEGSHTLHVDKLIVATGRKPNTENLAAAEANLLLDENGYVHVDANCRTTLPAVYAIGDLTLLGPMLAHKGMEEGVYVAEQIAGLHSPINFDRLPSVIFTDPEIAWVGQTEQALRAVGEPIRVGIYYLRDTAKAQAIGKLEGMVKIITHAETDTILGVHIIGTHAAELIAEAVLAMEFASSSEDLVRTIHAHPTLSEALHNAALGLKVQPKITHN
jgi:dihydrolipoamide dehydrogenase